MVFRETLRSGKVTGLGTPNYAALLAYIKTLQVFLGPPFVLVCLGVRVL